MVLISSMKRPLTSCMTLGSWLNSSDFVYRAHITESLWTLRESVHTESPASRLESLSVQQALTIVTLICDKSFWRPSLWGKRLDFLQVAVCQGIAPHAFGNTTRELPGYALTARDDPHSSHVYKAPGFSWKGFSSSPCLFFLTQQTSL